MLRFKIEYDISSETNLPFKVSEQRIIEDEPAEIAEDDWSETARFELASDAVRFVETFEGAEMELDEFVKRIV